MNNWQVSRRAMLRGLGAAVALPALEAMLPSTAYSAAGRAAAADAGKAPKRLAFVFVPNGKHMQDWTPGKEGADFELPWILEPLKPVKNDLLVLTGLTHDKARANGDGGGDHARSASCFLTGCQPLKTDGANIRAGISADQYCAQKIGHFTKYPSLELGCDRGPQSGNCDSGYSCAYSGNISWKSPSTPMAKEIDPRLVFERLFNDPYANESPANRAKREKYERSILDFVLEDTRRLQTKLGASDLRKLDDYLTSVREIERRISNVEKSQRSDMPKAAKPDGIPREYEAHLRLMCDLMVLAFQTDTTRISTCMFANESSNRNYPFIQVNDGHHDLSHHGKNAEKLEKIRKINRFHITQFGYFLEKLKSVKEGNGTLLDNCMIAYGSAISDGDRHNHDDLPILVAGGGGGSLKPGRHIKYAKETPLNNLWLALLDRMGTPSSVLGDSTGPLGQLV